MYIFNYIYIAVLKISLLRSTGSSKRKIARSPDSRGPLRSFEVRSAADKRPASHECHEPWQDGKKPLVLRGLGFGVWGLGFRVGIEGIIGPLHIPFHGFYRALIPSFPTKNQPEKGLSSHRWVVLMNSGPFLWGSLYRTAPVEEGPSQKVALELPASYTLFKAVPAW